MNCIKSIGSPGSAARWDQDRQELFDLIGANLLAQGISVTESQSVNLADAIMDHLYGRIKSLERDLKFLERDLAEERRLSGELAQILNSVDECFDRDGYGSGSDGW